MARESAAHVFWSDMRGRSPAFPAAPVADIRCGGWHRFPGFRLRCGATKKVARKAVTKKKPMKKAAAKKTSVKKAAAKKRASGKPAADLASGERSQAFAPLPAFTWTGFYIGANLGAWVAPANPSYEAIGFPSAGFDLVPNGGGQNAGVTGGFQAGYNYQIGSFVPGVEADFDYLGNCRGGIFAASPSYVQIGIRSCSLPGGCSYYSGTLRGRLGYAFDRVLVYGTGGIAFGGNRNPGSVVARSHRTKPCFRGGRIRLRPHEICVWRRGRIRLERSLACPGIISF